MFVGEAPGRLGADGSEIPFHGDKAGDNFEGFLSQVGINRYQIFVTNAVLCNPKDVRGNNSTPNFDEIANCAGFLKRQVELVNPAIIVTLGATALKSLSMIEGHSLNLKNSVRHSYRWFGRTLIPLYHPGQRALIHRSFPNQLADYQYVAEQLRRIKKPTRKTSAYMKGDVFLVTDFITSLKTEMSYFALHKLFYLVEYEYAKTAGSKLTSAYFIRQKDGPYCTDLHIRKLQNYIADLQVVKKKGVLHLRRKEQNLFSKDFSNRFKHLNCETRELIMSVIEKYGEMSNSELKTKVYLTQPMRRIRKSENKGNNLFNSPITFAES